MRFLSLATLVVAVSTALSGQSRPSLPRTSDGHPDLQGVYDLATLTPLERAAGQSLVLTDEEAARLEKQVAERKFRAGLPSKGDREGPPAGGDGATGGVGHGGGHHNL